MITLAKKIKLLIMLLFFISAIYITPIFAESPVLSDKQNTWLQENVSSISFAPEKDFPPLIWSEHDELFGLSNDYFDFIQQLIEVRFKTKEPRSLDEILLSVKNGEEKSIISSRAPTPERAEYLLFTRPYFSSPAIFVNTKGKPLTGKDIQQNGYIVAVGNMFSSHEYLKERYPEMKFALFDNDYQVIQSVINHKSDVAAINVISLIYLTQKNDFPTIRKVGDTGFVSDFSFAVPKDMPELRNIIDNAIEAIPPSFKKSVLEKWGVDSISTQTLLNDQDILVTNSVDKKYITILFLIFGFFIIIFEFLLHHYIFKHEEGGKH